MGKLIIALSAGFTPSPSSLTISSVPPALLPDSSLARWTLPADPGSHLHGHSIAANKTRPGCLHANVNKVTVYHLKAVSVLASKTKKLSINVAAAAAKSLQ